METAAVWVSVLIATNGFDIDFLSAYGNDSCVAEYFGGHKQVLH